MSRTTACEAKHPAGPHVPDGISAQILEDIREFAHIARIDPEESLPLFLDPARFDEVLDELRDAVGPLEGRRILEVGCGYGMLLLMARQRGLDFHGLEPPRDRFEGRHDVARRLLEANGIEAGALSCGPGESMPYPDASFDVVFSYTVLEHVHDPLRVLSESWRVLRPGGVLYVNAPSYRTFFEGHYNLPWIPGMGKGLARIWLRLWGRDPSYIEHLNFLTPARVRRWLEQVTGAPVESDLGLGHWVRRMRNPSFKRGASPRLVRYVKLARGLGMLRLVAWLGERFEWQDSIRVTLTRPETGSTGGA